VSRLLWVSNNRAERTQPVECLRPFNWSSIPGTWSVLPMAVPTIDARAQSANPGYVVYGQIRSRWSGWLGQGN
jgi:hypothetical protein